MKRSPTLILMAIIISVFVLQIFFDLDGFAFVPAKIMEKPWTLVTSIFLHADIEHIFFNMFALFFFGLYLERFISFRNYIILFIVAGIFGNLGYMLTSTNPSMPVVGASGSIYGVMGCLASIRPFAIVYVFFAPIPLVIAAIIWTITEFLGIFTPSYIAHGSHLFGLIVGIIVGMYIKKLLNYRKTIFNI